MTPPPPGCASPGALVRGGGGRGGWRREGRPRSSLCTAASLQSPGSPPGAAALPQVIPDVS